MNRKEFISSCGISCLGFIGVSLATSCKPAKQVQGIVSNNQLQIDKKEFEIHQKNKISYHKTLICKMEKADYPIVIYRFSDTDYKAMLLRCTHQNNELNVNGDIMTCPAHGSEFSTTGEVIQGPAEQKLHSYKVTSDEKTIYIHLI